ncbi:hypothetical protein XM38_033180 [Halomicronema hongdechloris C2206]|uniref:Uncharacterized protein n=1 Tax=Halomicronema hongdechloris C2206 TaxID=1641165 RepID=A0A1Z3HPX5_9CYAN|nr:hypothetical protein [Halomicronema hongdechloris]ASC72361.1 hypothetical protein XM38_033180 [Halomicronema hongdechloris C2206]
MTKVHIDLPNFPGPAARTAESAATTPPASAPRATTAPKPDVEPPSTAVSPYPVQPGVLPKPTLPRMKRPSLGSHRHDANAVQAIDLMQTLQQTISGWHQQLRQTLLEIQALYMEGPIVEGWLAPVDDPNQPLAAPGLDPSMWRHGDLDQVKQQVEHLCRQATQQSRAASAPASVSTSSGSQQTTQYQLCSLDADGRLQCQPCPPEELAVVTLAIARHKQLRQRLNQKGYLEARLKRAAELLRQVQQELTA